MKKCQKTTGPKGGGFLTHTVDAESVAIDSCHLIWPTGVIPWLA